MQAKKALEDPQKKKRLAKPASERFTNFAKKTDWVEVRANRVSIEFDSEEKLIELLNQLAKFLSESEPEKMPADGAVPAQEIIN